MKYKAEIINKEYALFAIPVRECPVCGRLMVNELKVDWPNEFFSTWNDMNQKAQMERAGLVYKGSVKVDGEYICADCEKSNIADFKCELCGDRKPTSKIQEVFGEPEDYLCQDCYAITPVKIWDEKCNELKEKHKYDFYL